MSEWAGDVVAWCGSSKAPPWMAYSSRSLGSRPVARAQPMMSTSSHTGPIASSNVLGALATALHLAQDAGDLAAEFEIDGALRILEDELAT